MCSCSTAWRVEANLAVPQRGWKSQHAMLCPSWPTELLRGWAQCLGSRGPCEQATPMVGTCSVHALGSNVSSFWQFREEEQICHERIFTLCHSGTVLNQNCFTWPPLTLLPRVSQKFRPWPRVEGGSLIALCKSNELWSDVWSSREQFTACFVLWV